MVHVSSFGVPPPSIFDTYFWGEFFFIADLASMSHDQDLCKYSKFFFEKVNSFLKKVNSFSKKVHSGLKQGDKWGLAFLDHFGLFFTILACLSPFLGIFFAVLRHFLPFFGYILAFFAIFCHFQAILIHVRIMQRLLYHFGLFGMILSVPSCMIGNKDQ